MYETGIWFKCPTVALFVFYRIEYHLIVCVYLLIKRSTKSTVKIEICDSAVEHGTHVIILIIVAPNWNETAFPITYSRVNDITDNSTQAFRKTRNVTETPIIINVSLQKPIT